MKKLFVLFAVFFTSMAQADGSIACERGAIDRNLNEQQKRAFTQRCKKDGGAAEAVLQCEKKLKNARGLQDIQKESIMRLCIAELVAPRR